MIQGTQEWHDLRQKHIGASDAPVIMGVSPWKNTYQLWEEKVGQKCEKKSTPWINRGIELEPIARQAYIDHTGIKVTPQVKFHAGYEWMMASLDGLSEDQSIAVEIKCPGPKDHEQASQGKIPEKYYPQLQHQLAVIDANMLHYFSYDHSSFYLIEVNRDQEYIDKMIEEEKKFWDQVQTFSPPDKEWVRRSDEEWCKAALHFIEIKDQMDKLSKLEKEVREKLIDLCEDEKSMGSGIKIQKRSRKGSVQYKNIPELEGIDLDIYRGKPIENWTITLE